MKKAPVGLEHVKCDLCGSDESLPLFDRGRNDEQVFNVVCQRCGLVFVNPRKPPGQVLSHYASGEFSISARGSYRPSSGKLAQSEQAALARFRVLDDCLDLGSIDPANVLEIGCGVGSFLRLMRGAGWDVQGIEPDPNYAEAGEQEYGISIMPKLFEESDLGDSRFDAVCLFHVVEHVLSPSGLLKRIREVLSPNGVVFLECPCIERPYGGDLERFFWSDHLYSFSVNTMKGLLEGAGFDLVKSGYNGLFLWTIARKSEDNRAAGPAYPFDEPGRVRSETLRRHKHFTRMAPLQRRRVWRIPSLAQSALVMLRDQPGEFIPAVRSKAEQWASRAVEPSNLLSRRLSGRAGSGTIFHFGLHSPGNAGDTVLFPTTRRLFDRLNGSQRWRLEPLWNEVTEETVRRINREGRAVLIGGGGLLLRDTNPNANSGWQWNCSLERLQQFEVPIVVFAIGYNRFRGQDDFDTILQTHIAETVRRSIFFGLRNHGSIRSLLSCIPDDLGPKLRFQPCPTTLLSYLSPANRTKLEARGSKCLALNVAFDRARMRYGGGEEEDRVLSEISRAMKWANSQGWKIHLVMHNALDDNMIPWLIRHKVDFTEVHLGGIPAHRVIEFYRAMPLTIGTRGHSQMIPFGLQNRVISLISHDKLGYFLEDIGHPEWGIDVRDQALESKLRDKIQEVGSDRAREVTREIVEAQTRLWDVTETNMRLIREALS